MSISQHAGAYARSRIILRTWYQALSLRPTPKMLNDSHRLISLILIIRHCGTFYAAFHPDRHPLVALKSILSICSPNIDNFCHLYWRFLSIFEVLSILRTVVLKFYLQCFQHLASFFDLFLLLAWLLLVCLAARQTRQKKSSIFK